MMNELNLQACVDKFVKWAEKWLVKINYSKINVRLCQLCIRGNESILNSDTE